MEFGAGLTLAMLPFENEIRDVHVLCSDLFGIRHLPFPHCFEKEDGAVGMLKTRKLELENTSTKIKMQCECVFGLLLAIPVMPLLKMETKDGHGCSLRFSSISCLSLALVLGK
jgi:hypothetical protein